MSRTTWPLSPQRAAQSGLDPPFDLLVQSFNRIRDRHGDHGARSSGRNSVGPGVLMHGAPLHWSAVPAGGVRLLQPRRAVNDKEVRPSQPALDEVIEHVRQASALSPPMLLTASSTLCPSARTPMTTSSEIEVVLRSSRTRTAVPSRTRRRIGSSARERVFQASQSCFTLSHSRLTMSCLPRHGTA